MDNDTSRYGMISDFDGLMHPLVERLVAGIVGLTAADERYERRPIPAESARAIDKGNGIITSGDRYVFGIVSTTEDPPARVSLDLVPITATNGGIQAMVWAVKYEHIECCRLAGSVPSDDVVTGACEAIIAAVRERRRRSGERGEINGHG